MTRADTDRTLQARVTEALQNEEHVNSAHIGVSAEGGAVTLSGEVSTEEQRQAAVEAVRSVEGLIALADELEVTRDATHEMNDTDIAVHVVRALERARLADGHVKVEVVSNIVVLSGMVPCLGDRETAELAALQTPGVLNVINRIEIGPVASLGDVQGSILQAFLTTAQRHAETIVIDIADGHVELRGSVKGLAERELAEQSARATPGVRSVKSHLRVHA
jgi:osmotically-inducible protein OsmY